MKKIAIVTCATAMITSMACAFTDVTPEHWAYKPISIMYSKSIVKGFEDGTFQPQKAVTREEFATILSKGLDLNLSSNISFNDVEEGRWSKEYIDKISEYMNVYQENGVKNFKPTIPATRNDVIVAIVKALNLSDSDVEYRVLEKFIDRDKIDNDSKKYIGIALQNGIISGNADNTLNLDGELTRAEICTIINNSMKLKDVDEITLDVNGTMPGWVGFDIKVCFNKLPEKAVLILDNQEEPFVEIDVKDIEKQDNTYVWEYSKAIKEAGKHELKCIAYYNGEKKESKSFNFNKIIEVNEERFASRMGHMYEQVVPPREGMVKPSINHINVECNEGIYTLTIDDYTCHEKDWAFFYWEMSNGEFIGSNKDYTKVECIINGDASATATIGDGLGWIASHTVSIKPTSEKTEENNKESELPLRDNKTMEELIALNGGKPEMEYKGNRVALYMGKVSENKIESFNDVITELNCIRGLLNIEDSRFEFVPMGEKGDYGENTYALQQVYNGIPVINTKITVSVDEDGFISSVLSSSYNDKIRGTDTNATISEEKAIEIAKKHIEKEGYSVDEIEVNGLVIAEENEGLVWDIYSTGTIHINAHTGEVDHYNRKTPVFSTSVPFN